MFKQFPVFKKAKVIPQPKVCFCYCKNKNVFDVFNRGSLSFMGRMNGLRSGSTIVEEIQAVFPKISRDVIEKDYISLASYLLKRGYITLEEEKVEETPSLELENRETEIKPVYGEIELTRNCNLSCAYCYANVGKGRQENDAPIEHWKRVLTALKQDGLRAVKVSGGEPFLYQEFERFMEFCSREFIVSLNTNGWYIDKSKAKWLSSLNLQCVQVSLDSATKEWHNKVRGRGSWERAMDAIQNLYEFKVPIRISSTITNGNQGDIDGLRAIAKRFKAETNFEIMKPSGRASALQDEWFLSDACDVTKHNIVSPIYKSLSYLEIKCQAQLGFIGISSRGNIKPCNLPESFFYGLRVAAVSPVVPGNFRYSATETYKTTEDYCAMVVAAQPRKGGRPYDRCIFYHNKET